MPLRLQFSHNISTHRFALILVNTTIEKEGCDKTLPWPKAAETGEQAEKLMSETFDCTDVVKVVNGTKSEIIAAFDTLQAKVDDFDKNKKINECAFVGLTWIGYIWF